MYIKTYRRVVEYAGPGYIRLRKTAVVSTLYPDGGVYGDGIPEAGDVIVQFGSYTDKTRQYVIVRDVIDGGYERFLGGLNSASAAGEEYFFAGRQTGMYGSLPRLFIGDKSQYVEFREGKLTILGDISQASVDGEKVSSLFANTASELTSIKQEQSQTGEKISAINQKADSISLSVTNNIGWMNLLKNTDSGSGWLVSSPTNKFNIKVSSSNGKATITFPIGGSGDNICKSPLFRIDAAGTYTFSFQLVASDISIDKLLLIELTSPVSGVGTIDTQTVTSYPGKKTIQFTVPQALTAAQVCISMNPEITTVQAVVTGLMFEFGEVAHDWVVDTSLKTQLRRTGIDIDDGSITLDAENTFVTGNLLLNGQMLMTKRVVDIADLETYGFRNTGGFDISKVKSTWIEFTGKVLQSNYEIIYLPSALSEEDWSLINSSLFIVNKSDSEIAISGPASYRIYGYTANFIPYVDIKTGSLTQPLKPGQCVLYKAELTQNFINGLAELCWVCDCYNAVFSDDGQVEHFEPFHDYPF